MKLKKFLCLFFALGTLIFNSPSFGVLSEYGHFEVEEEGGRTYSKITQYHYERGPEHSLSFEEISRKYPPSESLRYDISPITKKAAEFTRFKEFFSHFLPPTYPLNDSLRVSIFPFMGSPDQYHAFVRFYEKCHKHTSAYDIYKKATTDFCGFLDIQRIAFTRYVRQSNPHLPCDPGGLTWYVNEESSPNVIGIFRIEKTDLSTYSCFSVFLPALKDNQTDITRMLASLRANIMMASGFRRK